MKRFWGWGIEEAGAKEPERQFLQLTLEQQFDMPLERTAPPTLDEISLPPPRLTVPVSLQGMLRDDVLARAGHSYGKSYADVVRAVARHFPHPPDLVAYPSTESELVSVLDWCASSNIAIVPYGGGTSVVGGVETDIGEGYRGCVTIDLSYLDKVVEVDTTSLSALIQAGATGPAIDAQLSKYGLTLRHYPQSFEFSTLGGWIATRAAGHYATVYTHIDEMVESLRVISPSGIVETRRLPASGAGPSPDRFFIGSEGTLGIITEAWMRVQRKPTYRVSRGVFFDNFNEGVECVKELAQSGLYPTNCRLLDPGEALLSGSGDGMKAVLILGFESADHRVEAVMSRGMEICAAHGGSLTESVGSRNGVSVTEISSSADVDSRSVSKWKDSFIRAPYLRDELVLMGIIVETFETAVTWDHFDELDEAVIKAVRGAFAYATGSKGWITRRFTHIYPDGPAVYYTVVAPGRAGAELEQWRTIKQAASEAVLANFGTITHHHAVGRDHRRWYELERPYLFAEILAAAKKVLDPGWVMNPGVLIEQPKNYGALSIVEH